MMTMTDAAGGFLSELLEDAPPETAIRLVVEPHGLTSKLDTSRPGDTALNHSGRRVLLLDGRASMALSDKKLDVQDTDDGPRLRILS